MEIGKLDLQILQFLDLFPEMFYFVPLWLICLPVANLFACV